jgi:hypothetical protein
VNRTNFHTLPFGSLEAKVCVVLDNRHIDIGTKTSDSGWIPWLLRSVGFHEDNTLLFTYNHTYRGLYDSIASPEDEDHIARRRTFTRLLINNSNLRVVLLCGPASRDEILASLRSGTPAVHGPHILDFRGQNFFCWLQRHPDNNICRMFVESPEPFPVLLGSDWRKALKLGEVFKIAIATTDIKVDACQFESCSFTTRVLKKLWSDRSNRDVQPWTPENLDPVVRHYLRRRGFTTTEELEELQRTNSDGSLVCALVVLLQCFRKKPKQARTRKRHRHDHVKSSGIIPSKHQKIDQHEMEAVSKLYAEAETRRSALQPTEKPLISIKHAEEIVEECVESEFSDHEPIQTDEEENDVESDHEPMQTDEEEKDVESGHEPIHTDEEEKDVESDHEPMQTDEEEKDVESGYEPVQTDEEEKDVESDHEPMQTDEEEKDVESGHEPMQTDEEEKDVESGIWDDTTLDQHGASNVRHADSMDDLTWQLDVGLPPCADAVQTLLKYEQGLTTRQSGIHTSIVTDLCSTFDSAAWVAGLLAHGRRYKCTDRGPSKVRSLEMKHLSIRLPDGMNAISIRPELAPQGQAHPNRFIRKWLPELEPASRLAIKGWGEKEDGSDFSDWLYDKVGQKDHLVTAMRIFHANTIVDWLEGLIGSVSLRPRRYATKSETTSCVKDFAEEHKSKWL